MPAAVVAIGALVTAVSLFFLVNPGALPALLDKVFGGRWLYGAALLRLLLGAALIGSADTVAYPGAIAVIGWLFALGGIVLVVITPAALRRMTAWFGHLSPTLTRAWLSLALSLGLFLLYAALL